VGPHHASRVRAWRVAAAPATRAQCVVGSGSRHGGGCDGAVGTPPTRDTRARCARSPARAPRCRLLSSLSPSLLSSHLTLSILCRRARRASCVSRCGTCVTSCQPRAYCLATGICAARLSQSAWVGVRASFSASISANVLAVLRVGEREGAAFARGAEKIERGEVRGVAPLQLPPPRCVRATPAAAATHCVYGRTRLLSLRLSVTPKPGLSVSVT
jgi:hypothetical protein